MRGGEGEGERGGERERERGERRWKKARRGRDREGRERDGKKKGIDREWIGRGRGRTGMLWKEREKMDGLTSANLEASCTAR